MKTFLFTLLFLFSYPTLAACKCNCDLMDTQICASSYDLDHPCKGICNTQTPTTGPIGRTACPTVRIYNESKAVYEWISLCSD